MALNDADESVWYTRGLILAALERHEEALSCFARAQRIDSGFVAALDRQGEAYQALGRWAEAREIHAHVCRTVDPMRIRAWVNLAHVNLRMDDVQAALDTIARARSTVGDDYRLTAIETRCLDSLGAPRDAVPLSEEDR